jgi:putative phosphoesterase
MKIAALADVHGNYQALIAAIDHFERWKPDQVLVLGDIINRGPRSVDCLHLIQEKEKTDNWQVIKGNHEGYVLDFIDPDFPLQGPEFEMRKIVYWTYQSLNEDDIKSVVTMPENLDLVTEDQQVIYGLHASAAGDRIGIYPDSTETDLENLVDSKVDVFLVGHTHQPFIKSFQETIVVNVGSVGLPFDGDKRSAYAQITYDQRGWSGEIIRLDYDLSAAARDYEISGLIPDGGPLAELVLAELKLGWPQLSHWFRRYEEGIIRGEINLDQAVAEYLKNPSIEKTRNDIPMIYRTQDEE